jgi:hypothetical protein
MTGKLANQAQSHSRYSYNWQLGPGQAGNVYSIGGEELAAQW